MLRAALLLGIVSPQTSEPAVESFLQAEFRLSASDLVAIDRGHVVVKRMKERGDREVALLGVVKIAASAQTFVERFRNVQPFLRDKYLAQIGLFGSSAEQVNLDSLMLRRSDLKALRKCRPNACDVNLDSGAIKRVAQLDWDASDVRDQATRFMRERLEQLAKAYLAQGDSQLIVYDHKPEPLSVRAGTQVLLHEAPSLLDFSPELRQHLAAFPNCSHGDVEDFLYWTVQVFGFRPVTSLMHAAIHEANDEYDTTVIVLKQIYASHYVHAALKVMALINDTSVGGEPGIMLVFLDRTIFDFGIGGLKRAILERILASYLESHVERMRQRAEGGNSP